MRSNLSRSDTQTIAAHGNALAVALRMPGHSRLLPARLHLVAVGGSAFANGSIVGIVSRDRSDTDGFADSVELMVSSDLFDQLVAIVFKQNEVPHVTQKQLRIEEAANDILQLEFQQRPIVFVLDRFPRHERFFVRRQRTDSRCNAIADDQSHVIGQQVGDSVFVSLQLRVSLPSNGRCFCRGPLFGESMQLFDYRLQRLCPHADKGTVFCRENSRARTCCTANWTVLQVMYR